jgi:hypothetical protein
MGVDVFNAQVVVGKILNLGLGLNSPSTRCVQTCQNGLEKM